MNVRIGIGEERRKDSGQIWTLIFDYKLKTICKYPLHYSGNMSIIFHWIS